MYEKILAAIGTACVTLGVLWFVCRRDSHGRTGSRTRSDADPVRDNLERAGEDNQRLEDAERATSDRLREQAETIERAGEDNRTGQELVQKARHILHSAKHID